MNSEKKNPFKGKSFQRLSSVISQSSRYLGLPLFAIGLITLAATFICDYTPNWLLGSGFACVFIGTIVYFEQIKHRSKF